MRFIPVLLIIVLLTFSYAYANPFSGGGNSPFSGGKPPVHKPAVEKPVSNSFYNYLSDKQQVLKRQIIGAFRNVEEKPLSPAFLSFIALCFAYGVFHSMGPGHAKTLVSGYLLTTPAGLARSALFGLTVALGHAFTAFVLVLVTYYLLKMSVTAGFDSASAILSKVSYSIILFIGLYLLYKKLRRKEHSHESGRGFLGTAALISLTPCPGAMVLAMFAVTNGRPMTGALAVLSMAFGMALTICSVAVLTYLFRYKLADGGGFYRKIYGFLEFAGIAILLSFSSFMLI